MLSAGSTYVVHIGRRQILNCLVSVFELFEKDEDRKILNELYVCDYLVWIQQVHPVTIENYSKLIEAVGSHNHSERNSLTSSVIFLFI